MYIEDASRVTAGPRVLAIVEELSRSAYLGSVMGQLLHTCWKNLGGDLSDTGCIADLREKRSSTFSRQRVQKCAQKSYQKSKKTEKIGVWRCFGRSGGLPGAMSSRLGRRSAKMHTRSRPNVVASWGSSWGQNILKNWFKIYYFFKSFLL